MDNTIVIDGDLELSKPVDGEFGTFYMAGGGTVVVDAELSETSVNPVQNKVITNALREKAASSDLAIVATSGDYEDLSNKPSIPVLPTFADVAISGDYDDLENKPDIPSKTSDLDNDSGYITGYTETDPTVPSWAKAPSKPSYTASEVGALPSDTSIPSKTSDLTNDSGFLTQHQDISGKADKADLATVATSGDYDDLTNKPTIPTGIPSGGTAGQFLVKASGTDYDVAWMSLSTWQGGNY